MEGRRQLHDALTANAIATADTAKRNASPLHGLKEGLHVHDFNLEVLRFAVSVSELDIVRSRREEALRDSAQGLGDKALHEIKNNENGW